MFASSSAASTSSRTQNGHRPDLEHGQQQRHGGERPLATREHRQRLALLARRAGGDLDAGRAEVLGLGQRELRLAAVEELLEAPREGVLERRERGPELLAMSVLELAR